MAKDNCQKIKLLKLMEILQQETDEQHPMRAVEICSRLTQLGISCDRRTLTRDMALLNEQGFEVMSIMLGHEKGYYIEDRSFSIPELKILIDAVQAANCITEKKTKELVEKIAALGGSHCAEILKRNMVWFTTQKHSNESIYYTIDCLEEAIEQQRKIIFCYYDLDANKQKVYRRGGGHYVVEPVGLVFKEDNYYLMVYSARHDDMATYRVDRMDRVEITQEPICEKALEQRQRAAGYTDQMFKMYGGHLEQVTLRFDEKLIGSVYDKFGEDIQIDPADAQNYEATVSVQVSPTFWGWIFQFDRKMRIAAPEAVRAEYKKRVEALME